MTTEPSLRMRAEGLMTAGRVQTKILSRMCREHLKFNPKPTRIDLSTAAAVFIHGIYIYVRSASDLEIVRLFQRLLPFRPRTRWT